MRAWLSATLGCCAALGVGCSDGADSGLDRAAEAEADPTLANTTPIGQSPGLSDGQGQQVGGADSCSSLGAGVQRLSVVDRTLVGSPAAYLPDSTLRAQGSALVGSQRQRRQRAWEIATRVLTPVALAELLPDSVAGQLPRFQTWHGRDDITRIFRSLYADLSDAERRQRARWSRPRVEAAWRANDSALANLDAWSEQRRRDYVAALDEANEVHGLGGLTRVAYSPAASLHLLLSYPEILACAEAESPDAFASEEPDPTPGCAAPRPKPACLMSEFPPGAAIVKASFRRADAGIPLAAFDTSAAALGERLAASEPSWQSAEGQAVPSSEQAFTLKLPNGNSYWLAGLHIMTKELDDWFWLSLWWSADPRTDFGGDRPQSLPAPFDHYKLCAVVDFAEGDPDSGGGFAAASSLAQALAAAGEGVGSGGPTWCSNPYIETESGAASTNCIGCHQHAGYRLTSQQILADPQAHPLSGRLRERRQFAADYVFALNQGDSLGAMFRETEQHYVR